MGGPPSCRRVRNSLAQRTHAPAQAPLYKPAERIQPEACDKGPRDTHLGHSFLSPGLDVDAGGKGRGSQGTARSSGSRVDSPRHLEPAGNSCSRAHPALPIRCSGGVRLQRVLEVDRRPPSPPGQMLGGYPTSERPGGGQTPTQTSRSDAWGVGWGVRLQRGLEVDRCVRRPSAADGRASL